MLDTLFLMINLIPLPYWLLMVFWPRHPYTHRLASGWAAFALLGVIYVVLLGWGLIHFNSGSFAEPLPPLDLSFTGLAALLGTPIGFLIAWTHLLTFDLFVGIWIYQDSLRRATPWPIAGFCLVATLLAGPLGFLLFLVWRSVGQGAADA